MPQTEQVDDFLLLVRAADALRRDFDTLFPDMGGRPIPAYGFAEALMAANHGQLPESAWSRITQLAVREVELNSTPEQWDALDDGVPVSVNAWSVWEDTIGFADDVNALAAVLERAAQAVGSAETPPRDVRDVSQTTLSSDQLLATAINILESGSVTPGGFLPEPEVAFRQALLDANGGSEKGEFAAALALVERSGCAASERRFRDTRSDDVADAMNLGGSHFPEWLFEPYSEALEDALVAVPAQPSAFEVLAEAATIMRHGASGRFGYRGGWPPGVADVAVAIEAANGGAFHPQAWIWVRRLARLEARAMVSQPNAMPRWNLWYDCYAPAVNNTSTFETLAAVLERAAQLSANVATTARDIRAESPDEIDPATLVDEARRILLSGLLLDHGRLPDPATAYTEAVRRANGGSIGGHYADVVRLIESKGCAAACAGELARTNAHHSGRSLAPFRTSSHAPREFFAFAEALDPVAVAVGAPRLAFLPPRDAASRAARDVEC